MYSQIRISNPEFLSLNILCHHFICVCEAKAAEQFHYAVSADIRELISVDDVTEELCLGPNGALVYCMEYLLKNIHWLEDILDRYIDGDYIVFDFPGQIELYTHFPFMRDLVRKLHQWNIRVQALYFLDCQFIGDPSKFFGGCITALSAMIQLEVPHINVMSKMDLASSAQKKHLEDYIYPEMDHLTANLAKQTGPRFARLNRAMANLLDQFSMVSFVPLDLTDEESLSDILLMVDNALQYDEEVETNFNYPDEQDDEDDDDDESQDENNNDG